MLLPRHFISRAQPLECGAGRDIPELHKQRAPRLVHLDREFLFGKIRIVFDLNKNGFFVPTGVGPITLPVFLVGSSIAVVCLVLSIHLSR